MKRRSRVSVSIIALTILIYCLTPLYAHTKGSSFAPGETLKYTVQWEFIPAARVKLKVKSTQLDKRQVYLFILKASTNSFVNLFYRLDEKIEPYTDKDLERSYLYKERNKGSKDKRI